MNDKDIFKISDIVRDQIGLIIDCNINQRGYKTGSLISRLPEILRQGKLTSKAAANHQSVFDKCNRRFIGSIAELTKAIEFHIHEITSADKISVPGYREIMADVLSLSHEFDSVEYCNKTKVLSVTTEPIVLEDIMLGEFKVSLYLERLHEIEPAKLMHIEAINPNPAESNNDVIHPHVQGGKMCCGDGTLPMRMAIESGRLMDFFMIVAQVLRTYNPDSPFVSLENWHGAECYNCGDVWQRDDLYYCNCCENEFCSDCSTWCDNCEVSVCESCSDTCEACGESICRDCVVVCDCGSHLCKTCHENMECKCHEEHEDNEDQKQTAA